MSVELSLGECLDAPFFLLCLGMLTDILHNHPQSMFGMDRTSRSCTTVERSPRAFRFGRR